MKKILAAILVVMLAMTLFAFVGCETNDDFKIGVILIGDENEGYSKAHIDGITTAIEELEKTSEKKISVIWKKNTPEDSECTEAATDLAENGCSLIISNSFGHQDRMVEVAKLYPNIPFIAMTGNFAAICGVANLSNAFTNIYEARYVSGVVAGLKIKELVESGALSKTTQPNSFDANDNVKMGYVGAYNYAEVVSGYTAFYLGAKSVYEKVVMEVQYTGSWFSIEKEGNAAKALINNGCVIIGQHADSTGAPAATEEMKTKNGKICYSVGYNVSMLTAAPTAALTSSTNEWHIYYQYAIGQALEGEAIAKNWAKGYSDGAVAITELSKSCAANTAAKVAEVEAAIKAGTLHVFDTEKFTVKGSKVTSAMITLAYINFATGDAIYAAAEKEAIVNGYFSESTLRCAPYFELRIDGITEGSMPQ